MSLRTRSSWFKPSSAAARRPRRPLQLHLDYLEDRTLLSASIGLSSTSWTSLGPTNINAGEPVSGRITGLAADPTNASVIYAATAGGGVWKTSNGGASWTETTDNEPTLVIGAIAVAPSNPQVVYAGTGEANYGPSKQSISRANVFSGDGILVSTNGGGAWGPLEGTSDFYRRTISRIVVNPQNPDIVYVAVGAVAADGLPGNTGIWESTDGGTTWADTTASISTTAAFSDLAIDPDNGQILYAAVGDPYGSDLANGVYISTNGGADWSRSGNFPTGTDPNLGRITLAMSPSDPTTLYASIAEAGPYAHLYNFLKTTDGGQIWTSLLSKTPDYFDPGITLANGEQIASGDYDTSLAVDPGNPNIVYAGGVASSYYDFMQSTDGGQNWNSIVTDVNGQSLHGDEHAIAFDANGLLLDGNDGGVWRLEDNDPNSIVWQNLNTNLGTVQFEAIALSPDNPNIALGGSQDNGTEVFDDSTVWTETDGGDGGKVVIDPQNPQIMYHDSSIVSFSSDYFVEKSVDGGQDFNPITNGLQNLLPSNTVYYPPLVIDPTNDSRLLLGATSVYETDDGGTDWHPISEPGSNGWTGTSAAVDAIAIAPSAPNTIYATAGGYVFVTTDDGFVWQNTGIPANPSSGTGFTNDIASLAVSPINSQLVFAVRDSYTGSSAGHVYESTNGGQSWIDISGKLPDAPVNSVVFDDRTNYIYIGTNNGVYVSADNGTTWASFGGGLPNARVTQLALDPSDNILAAGTYGRGMWEIVVPSAATGSGTIQFSASGYSFSEYAGTVYLTVTRTGGSGTVSVQYAATNGTAAAGTDYSLGSGPLQLTFGPNVFSQTIPITILPDQGAITNLTFDVSLSLLPGGGTLGTPSSVQVTIDETNYGAFQFSSAQTEAGKEAGSVLIKVERVGGAAGSVTVAYATSNGTAQAGVDYGAASGTLTFAPGVSIATFSIPLLDNPAADTPLTVNLTLTDPTGGASLGSRATAVLVIEPTIFVPPVAIVQDLGNGPGPDDLTNVNGTLFFVADDELWRSDGTANGTTIVKTIGNDSPPEYLTNVSGTLYFTAADGTHGRQLWRSDGTAYGTYMVADVDPYGSADPADLTNVNGTLFFVANDGVTGVQLWRSDGTAAGTTEFALFNGDSGSYPTDLTNVNGTLYFAAVAPFLGTQLFKSNGTYASSGMVAPISEYDANPQNLTNVGGKLFFSANDGTHGTELWESDGTPGGTTMVKDINPGVSPAPGHAPYSSYPSDLTNINGVLYFVADQQNVGEQVWRSDGSPGGTLMLSDLNPGASALPADLTTVDGTLFFSAFTAEYGRQLYGSNGTAAGTAMLTDLNGPAGLNPTNLTNVNGVLYFAGTSTSSGTELWQSDGTSAGTVLVQDVNPGAPSSNPSDLTQAGLVLFFAASDGTSPAELWEVNNQPPTISAPGTQSSTNAATVVFSTVKGNAITVSDVDAGDGSLQVTLTATHGLLTLGSTNGLTFQVGTGSGNATMTFTGLLANINADLNGLTFTPSTSTGTAGLQLAVNNQGFTGFGGPQTTSAAVSIDLTSTGGSGSGSGGSGGGGVFSGTPGVVATAGTGSAQVLFALTTGDALYAYRAASGWTKLGVNIASISTATERSGDAVAFVVTNDHGLYRFSFTAGWQTIGGPGTIASVSAGTDSGGLADAFVITTAGDFVEFRGSSGWTGQIGGRGTILSAAAVNNDGVIVVTAGHSVAEYDPVHGWQLLTSPNFAQSVAAVRDTSGQLEIFATTLGDALFRYVNTLGWALIGNAGSIAKISAGTDASGQAAVFALTTQDQLAEYDTVKGWSVLQSPQPVGALAAGTVDQVFVELAGGSIYAHDDTFGFYPLTGAGFLGS